MINSRFKTEIPFYLTIATVFSFLLSLFLLQVFAGLLVILYLFEKYEDKKKGFDFFGSAFLVFVFVRIISVIFSEFQSISAESLYKDLLFYTSFFAFNFYLKVFDEKKYTIIINSFAAAAVVISLIGAIRFNLGSVERAQTFSSGYTTFSAYLLTGLGMQLFLFDETKPKRSILYWLIGTSLIIYGIIISLGRTNIAIGGLMFLIFIFMRKLKIRYAAIIVLLTAMLSIISFSANTLLVSQRIGTPLQLSDRDIIYKGAKEILFDHPVLGFGPRTFPEIFPDSLKSQLSDTGIGSWHNDFLQIYFESGILGEIAFLILLSLPFIVSIKYLNKKYIDKNSLRGALFSIGGLILSAVTSVFINSPVLSVVFAFLLAIIAREYKILSGLKKSDG
ncbi:MAG: O-antigen ligase family protein [Bacteroidota bacterium]